MPLFNRNLDPWVLHPSAQFQTACVLNNILKEQTQKWNEILTESLIGLNPRSKRLSPTHLVYM